MNGRIGVPRENQPYFEEYKQRVGYE